MAPRNRERLLRTLRRWKAVNAALASLTERQREIVLALLDGKELLEVGKPLSLTRERVRQINDRALERLEDFLFGTPEEE